VLELCSFGACERFCQRSGTCFFSAPTFLNFAVLSHTSMRPLVFFPVKPRLLGNDPKRISVFPSLIELESMSVLQFDDRLTVRPHQRTIAIHQPTPFRTLHRAPSILGPAEPTATGAAQCSRFFLERSYPIKYDSFFRNGFGQIPSVSTLDVSLSRLMVGRYTLTESDEAKSDALPEIIEESRAAFGRVRRLLAKIKEVVEHGHCLDDADSSDGNTEK
jgi:hypothetical protein